MNKSQKKLIVIGLSLLGVILIVWYFVKKSKGESITKGDEVEPTKPEIEPKLETQPKAEGSGNTSTIKSPVRQTGATKNGVKPTAPQTESGYGYQFTGYRCNCRGSFGEIFMGRETIDQIGIRGCDCGNAYYPMFMYAGPYIYPYPIYGRYPHKHKHKPKPVEPIFAPKQSIAVKTNASPKPMAVNQAGVVSQPISVAGGMSMPKPMPNVMSAPRAMTSPIGVAGGMGMPRPTNLVSAPRR